MNNLRKRFEISARGLNWFHLTLPFLDGISAQGGPSSLTILFAQQPLIPSETIWDVMEAHNLIF